MGLIDDTVAAAEEGARARLRVLDVAMLASTDPEPVPWLAEPFLARGATTAITGREGLGKSLFALAIAAAATRGDLVLDTYVEEARVVYVDGENGEREAHRRIRGLRVTGSGLVYVIADAFDLRRHFTDVEGLVADHEPDIVMLDSLRSLAPGLDENDSQQVEAALRPLTRLAQRRDIAALFLHHAGKDGTQ